MSNRLAAIHSCKINIRECHKQHMEETRQAGLEAVASEDIKYQLQQAQLACRMDLVVGMEHNSLAILSVQDLSKARTAKGEI